MQRLAHLIRQLPVSAEVAIVMVIAFGYFIAANFVSAAAVDPAVPPPTADNYLLQIVAIELVALILLVPFLAVRGWTISGLSLTRIRPIDMAATFGLILLPFILYQLAWVFLDAGNPEVSAAIESELTTATEMFAKPGLTSALLVSIVNPIFEEVFVVAYLMTALKDRLPAAVTVALSVAIRAAYHLYQGVGGLLFVVPFGLLVALWFWRTGRIWPAIAAHAYFDFFGLMATF
jgi:uncharacterized protein